VRADEPDFRIVAELEQSDSIDGWLGDRLEHIARHDPARVLAEVAAKRQIVELHFLRSSGRLCNEDDDLWPCETLRLLARPYVDHPDYRHEWRR
jgi:hypothetical protein